MAAGLESDIYSTVRACVLSVQKAVVGYWRDRETDRTMGGTITIKTPMAASNIEMPPNIAGLREAQTTVSFHSHGCVSTSSIGLVTFSSAASRRISRMI